MFAEIQRITAPPVLPYSLKYASGRSVILTKKKKEIMRKMAIKREENKIF